MLSHTKAHQFCLMWKFTGQQVRGGGGLIPKTDRIELLPNVVLTRQTPKVQHLMRAINVAARQASALFNQILHRQA